ncbi:MAG: hypothetical protein ABWY47_21255 [Xanthobacteraceae bacterium]
MRCMACGAEMALMNVVQDDTMAVSGFEHHTFMCSGCGDVEQRLVFAKPGEPSSSNAASPVLAKPAEPLPSDAPPPVVAKRAEPLPVHAAPPISPVPAVRGERAPAAAPAPAPGILQRMFARLRGRQDGGKTADA